MTKTLLVLTVVAMAGISACAARQRTPTADDVLARLSRGEIDGLLTQLQDERSNLWVSIHEGLEGGDSRWLNVACQLRRSTDGSASLGLDFSIARAIPEHAVAVLSLIGDCFKIEDVCTVPYIEDEERSASFVRRAEQALTQSVTPALASIARDCLAHIRKPANQPLQPASVGGQIFRVSNDAARG